MITVDEMFDRLFTTIQGCREKAVKTIKCKNRKMRQPWATKELLALVVEKSIAYKRHQADINNLELRNEYKEMSARVKREIRRAKTNYYSEQLDKYLDNPKKYWEIVNGVRGASDRQDIVEIEIGQEKVSASEEPNRVAEEFNTYFNQVPEKLLENNKFDLDKAALGSDGVFSATLDRDEQGAGYLKNLRLTAADVEKIIMRMKNKKSVGYDGLSAYIVKQLPMMFARVLTPLFNDSLRRGKFPEAFKLAVIVPIFKDGDKKCVENYRPISLLSVFSKIFENCVQEKLNNYLEHTKFYSPQQFGFLKGKSTDTALFTHITQITESVEHNKASVAVYLDLAKAFDTVNHRILIEKLVKAGIREKMLQWFMSYLVCRKHKVKINNVTSKELNFKHGVPQGSVLGPLLFNMYINDMFALPLRAGVVAYADDTSLFYSEATDREIADSFRHDVGLLLPWFRRNYLHLNISRCKSVIYAYKRPSWADEFELKMNNISVELVEVVKYLGLFLDSILTWVNHSLYVQSKLRKINYLFYHLRKHFKTFHLKKLYIPLYESVLSYGIIFWGACADNHLQPIRVLQNKVCRMILIHDYRTSEATIYTQMKVPRLDKLFKICISMFVFKNKWLFQLHKTGLKTRAGQSTVSLYVDWRKEHSRMQVRYQGSKVFNDLPVACRDERRLSVYKDLVKKSIMEFL